MQSTIKTRYCESDALGHISSISYLIYFEQARVGFILGQKIVQDIKKWPFVLASIHCDYKQQIFVSQEIVIETFVKVVGKSSFTLCHQIYDKETERLVAKGEEVIVNYDFELQKSVPLNTSMINVLKENIRK